MLWFPLKKTKLHHFSGETAQNPNPLLPHSKTAKVTCHSAVHRQFLTVEIFWFPRNPEEKQHQSTLEGLSRCTLPRCSMYEIFTYQVLPSDLFRAKVTSIWLIKQSLGRSWYIYHKFEPFMQVNIPYVEHLD